MIIQHSLSKTSLREPCALTIGSYDGVHRGHQKILQKMRELVGGIGSVVVISFHPHPSHVLAGREPVKPLFSLERKIELLKKYGVDALFLINFTPQLASLSYREFLQEVRDCIPFQFLVLGEGASLGKNREGNEVKLRELGKEKGFQVVFVEKLQENGKVISSGLIRTLVAEKNLKDAERFLGHSL